MRGLLFEHGLLFFQSPAEGNITVGHWTFTDQLECMTDHSWPWSDTMTIQFFLRWVSTHWYVQCSRDLMEVHNECENSGNTILDVVHVTF